MSVANADFPEYAFRMTAEVDLNGARKCYAADGYVLLPQLFTPLVLQVFHGKLQGDLNLKGDPRFVSNTALLSKPALEVYSRQYAPMAAFHWGATTAAAAIAGCELIPTYAYFRVYQHGDICRVHSDREACEHSLSLMIELSDSTPWPLCVGKDRVEERPAPVVHDFGAEEYAALPMSGGDAVMYRGVDHRHGRVEPNPNRWSAHLFMHWVDAAGPYAEHAFDRVALAKHGAPA
jgi:hypothetical protein